MKIPYLITALASALGLGLLIWGASSNGEMELLGVKFHPHLVKSVGLVTILLSIIAFLVVYGNSLPPTEAERRRDAVRLEISDRYRSRQDLDYLRRAGGTASPRVGHLAAEDRAPERISHPTKDPA